MGGELHINGRAPLGWWRGPRPHEGPGALRRIARPIFVHDDGITTQGCATLHADAPHDGTPLRGYVGALPPEALGDAGFRDQLGLRFNYVAGAMAGGIASVEVVEAMSRAGMLGVFGAAGLPLPEVEAAIDRLGTRLLDRPWAANLIHSPLEAQLESAVADLYIERGVRRVSASAYLGLTLPLLRYATAGIHQDAQGRIVVPNRVLAKVSRIEVAQKFLAPPPAAMLAELVARGDLSEAQAALAGQTPVASALTVEADSGGHTDNRPALALLPTMLALRDRLAPGLPVGAAGGIGTPHAAAAAFAMGAAFVVTGTINQGTREAGTSDLVREMLAHAEQADVAMAPAADMFEMGVKLQVLRRGTMFPMRAQKLWELYGEYPSLEAIPEQERATLERTLFRAPLAEAWAQTKAYWEGRDPGQAAKAEHDPRYRMALTFRRYLGQASRWANAGVADRKVDFQVWCGPAIGAFNEWVRGSFLEAWENRRVVPIAYNILHGACVLTRAAALRNQGVAIEADVRPRELAALEEFAL